MSESSPVARSGLIRTWFDPRVPFSAPTYLWSGIGLMAFKYAVEAIAVWSTTGLFYTPLHFLFPSFVDRDDFLRAAPDWVAIGIVIWSLPFMWIAVSMSIRRARVADHSPWQGIWVIVPFVNVPAMITLAMLPVRATDTASAANPPRELSAYPDPDNQIEAIEALAGIEAERREEIARGRSTILAIVAGLGAPFVLFPLTTYVLGDYGITLFYVTPFLSGVITGFVANFKRNQGLAATTGITAMMISCAFLLLLLLAFEGLICIAMAAPLVFPIGIAGGWMGWAIANVGSRDIHCALPCIVVLPIGTWVEDRIQDSPVYSVESVVVIDAPPEVVWRHVVEFPDLPSPTEWYFRAGISCPTGASIDGEGTTATRYCEFTTGIFVEPVTVWDPPHRLAFNVTSQPEPMFELSPYADLHPPHMHGTFITERGEFRLIALSGGRTRLEGETWYRIEMGPAAYWKLWCDGIIHGIHYRVLDHIERLAEET